MRFSCRAGARRHTHTVTQSHAGTCSSGARLKVGRASYKNGQDSVRKESVNDTHWRSSCTHAGLHAGAGPPQTRRCCRQQQMRYREHDGARLAAPIRLSSLGANASGRRPVQACWLGPPMASAGGGRQQAGWQPTILGLARLGAPTVRPAAPRRQPPGCRRRAGSAAARQQLSHKPALSDAVGQRRCAVLPLCRLQLE